MRTIVGFDAWLVKHVTKATNDFVHTHLGRWFLNLALIGPLTFIPTIWEVWTAPNIEVFRTLTWPFLAVINVSILISVCRNGDWRIRISMLAWILLMSLTSLATIVR